MSNSYTNIAELIGELNPGYWTDGVNYLQAAERKLSMPSLFDVLDDPAQSEAA